MLHTGIAVSCGSPVGLDVEAADRHTRTDVLKLAKRRFAPIELASLEGNDTGVMFLLWCNLFHHRRRSLVRHDSLGRLHTNPTKRIDTLLHTLPLQHLRLPVEMKQTL